MKKTLAILLSCMLVIAVVTAMAIFTSAEETVVKEVSVVTSSGTTVLNAETSEATDATGTIVFDAATGTLTITDTTTIRSIRPASGDKGLLTVKVVGENVMDTTTKVDNALRSFGGKMIFVGEDSAEDKLIFESDAGANWTLGGGSVVVDNVTLTIDTVPDGYNIVQIPNGESIVVKGNAVLSVTAGRQAAFDMQGVSDLVVEDDAKVYAHIPNTGSWGGTPLHFGGAGSITVKDNGYLESTATQASGVQATSASNITVTENGLISLSSPKGAFKAEPASVTGVLKKSADGTSAVITATTASAPTNLKAAAPADGKVALTWDAVGNAVAYEVYVGTEKVATVDTNAASIAVEAAKAYAVTVKSINRADIVSAASKVLNVVLPKENVAASVIVKIDGVEYTFDANTTEVAAGEGKVTFDPINGVLTLNNASKIEKINHAVSGLLTIKVVGTNTVAADANNLVWMPNKDIGSEMLITADDPSKDILNVNGKATCFQ